MACNVTNKKMSRLATDYHKTAKKFLKLKLLHPLIAGLLSQFIHLFGVPIRFGETFWLFYDNNMVK